MYLSSYQNVFVHIQKCICTHTKMYLSTYQMYFSKFQCNVTSKVECEGGGHKLALGCSPSFNLRLIRQPAGKLLSHTFNFNDCQARRRKTHKINCHIFGGNETNFSHKISAGFSARWFRYVLVTAFLGASGVGRRTLKALIQKCLSPGGRKVESGTSGIIKEYYIRQDFSIPSLQQLK